MGLGRSNEQWNHTASVMALLATIHSDSGKGKTFSPADFHPYAPAPEVPQATPELLEAIGFKLKKPPEVSDGG
jgi:hypothetical protein